MLKHKIGRNSHQFNKETAKYQSNDKMLYHYFSNSQKQDEARCQPNRYISKMLTKERKERKNSLKRKEKGKKTTQI